MYEGKRRNMKLTVIDHYYFKIVKITYIIFLKSFLKILSIQIQNQF